MKNSFASSLRSIILLVKCISICCQNLKTKQQMVNWFTLHPKQFHVSPFFTREGHYKFLLTEATGFLDNQINFYQDETLVIIARLQGQSEPLTPRNLLRTIIRHPLSAALTMPRILWQAAKLYWQRRLPVHNKPVPDHSMTIRPVAPSFLDRIGMILCFKFLSPPVCRTTASPFT